MRRPIRRRRSRGFTLVLGGGGARGLAHIGILKCLEEEGLVPAMLVGTSMGAIIGGMYAQHPDACAVEEKVRELLQNKDFRRIGLEAFSHAGAPDGLGTVGHLYESMRRGIGVLRSTWSTGIVDSPVMLEFLRRLLDDQAIEESAIPFAAVSCDLMTGREIVHQTGSILTAVGASSAIPGVVAPLHIDGRVLVDGAPTSIVPVLAARQLSRLPIAAVSVTLDVAGNRPVSNAIDVVLRAGAIARMHLAERNLEEADVVLRPHVEAHGWAEFSSMDEFIVEGERSAREALSAIAGLRRRPRLVRARLTR